MSVRVTVAVPTLNAGRGLQRLLRALKEQTVPCEIIIVDSSSSDDSVGIARSYGAKIITIKRGDFDHGGTRNTAVNCAEGDIVVFFTQDAIPADEHAVERLIGPFRNARMGAVYGRQLPNSDASLFARHMRLFKYPAQARIKSAQNKDLYGIETPFLSDSFSAYRKKALHEVGLFKQGILFAEDVHAGAKLILAGYQIAYAPDAAVYHSHNHSMGEECRRYFDTGVFYRTEAWIGETFGRNSREAWHYTRSEFSFVRKYGDMLHLMELLPRTAFRAIGFFLGRWHRILPLGLCRRLSAHPAWWERKHHRGGPGHSGEK